VADDLLSVAGADILNIAGLRTLRTVIGADDAGFFAITLVVLLLTLTSLALLGPYQLALAEWHSIQRVIQHEGGS
jgi:hypothetical protein